MNIGAGKEGEREVWEELWKVGKCLRVKGVSRSS